VKEENINDSDGNDIGIDIGSNSGEMLVV